MTILRYALLGSTLALGACAALPPSATGDDVIDTAYVNAVNHVAQQRGLQVVWMRYPTIGERR